MKRRILVVEDNEDTRLILRALLQHRGFEMLEVQSAEEMLELMENVAPDLIVLDVRLPGMDGCQALQQLRAGGSSVPVFLFSEYYDLFSERILTCRPDGFYPKSKGPVALIEGIQSKLATTTAH